MYSSIWRLFFLILVLSVPLAQAQQTAARSERIDLALTYDADQTNLINGSSFWMQGGSAQVAAALPHGLGVVAGVTGLHAGSISPSHVPLNLLTVAVGPRYAWRAPWRPGNRQISLFGLVLVGETHGFDSTFVSGQNLTTSATSFALQAGGGVDYHLSQHIGLRLFQVDWLRTQLSNGASNVQNHLNVDSGVTVHF